MQQFPVLLDASPSLLRDVIFHQKKKNEKPINMTKATVLAFIIRKEKFEEQILLTKRSDNLKEYPNKWCLPGGHIDENETASNAIIREVKEETGLDFSGDFFEYFDELIPEKNIHAVVIMFEGTSEGTLKLDKKEVSDAIWISPLDALSLDLAFQHREVIKNYITRNLDSSKETGFFQELSYLRGEILNRFSNRNKALHYTIIIAGILLGLSKAAIDYHVILLFPVIGTSLAALWSHNDLRISQIGRYIKNHVEPRYKGLNWQNYLSTVYTEHKSTLFKKFQEYTVLGIFYLTYGITIFVAIMLAVKEDSFKLGIFDYIIFALDALAFYVTWEFIRRRRKNYKKEQKMLKKIQQQNESLKQLELKELKKEKEKIKNEMKAKR